jgi:hypothetical protein
VSHPCEQPAILGRVFLEGLLLETVTPPATMRVERPKGPEISLGDYRDALVRARLLSLDQPAMYLDRSPTGTGKSYADRVAILSLMDLGGSP